MSIVLDRLAVLADAFREDEGIHIPVTVPWSVEGATILNVTNAVGVVPLDHTWVMDTYNCMVTAGVTSISHNLRADGLIVKSWACSPAGISQSPLLPEQPEPVTFNPGVTITLESTLVAPLGLHTGDAYFQFRDYDHRAYRRYRA